MPLELTQEIAAAKRVMSRHPHHLPAAVGFLVDAVDFTVPDPLRYGFHFQPALVPGDLIPMDQAYKQVLAVVQSGAAGTHVVSRLQPADFHYHSTGPGFCRINYFRPLRANAHLRRYCLQLANRQTGAFDFLVCSATGEPAYEIDLPPHLPLPPGNDSIEIAARRFLIRTYLHTTTKP